MTGQQRLHRLQQAQARVLVERLDLRQRDAALHAQAAGIQAAQKAEVRAAAQGPAYVLPSVRM